MKARQMKRTFFQFLGYYLLVALLPLVCVLLIYRSDMMEQTALHMQDGAASATQGVMRSLESHLSLIDGYPTQLYPNERVTDYRYNGTSINRRALIKELERMVGGNDLIVNLFVYFRNSNHFVSAYSNSWERQSMLEGNILIYDNIPAHHFMDTIDTMLHEQVMPAAMVLPTRQEQKSEVVTFLSTLPVNNRFAFATTITLVNGAKLRELLQSGGADAYLLLDATGRVIISCEREHYSRDNLLSRLPNGVYGAEYVSIEGEDVIRSFARSSASGYTLVRITSMEQLLARQSTILNNMSIILCLMSAVIALLILFFMRQTFTPIRELAAIAMRSGSDVEDRGTAFTLIRSAFHSLETENMQLSTHLEKQNPILAEYAVRTLLSTPQEHWNQHAYEVCLGIGLRLSCAAYQVMVMQFENRDEQLVALGGMIESCGKDYVASFPETLQNRIVLLMGFDLDTEPDVEALRTRIHFAAAGLGPVVDSVRSWNASYLRASYACDFAADTHEPGRFLRFDEITAEMDAPDYPWEELQILSAALNQGNVSMVQTAEGQLQNYIRRHSLSCPEEVRSVFIQILQMCLSALPERREEISRHIYMSRLKRAQFTGQHMIELIDEILDAFCRRETGEREQRENSPIYRSLPIIREEIGSEHLSLAYVAERVGISASRYSALFPQEMNRNFKEYVDSLRLNLAKQLLRSTDLQVGVVAARVGYRNAYSFTRFFKAKTGLTPGEYRGSIDQNKPS